MNMEEWSEIVKLPHESLFMAGMFRNGEQSVWEMFQYFE